MQDCYSLTDISYTNAYTHEHALPHLAAACADDDPRAHWAVERVKVVEDASDVV
jgi:hypothetical protein